MIPGVPWLWTWTSGDAPAAPDEIVLAGELRDITPAVRVRVIDLSPKVSVKTVRPRML